MDKLVRPLLILHGTNDTNVSFVDSLRLFDVLFKLDKPFESQIFPWAKFISPPSHHPARRVEARRGFL